MIAMALVGAVLGSVLFAAVLWVLPPRRSALVELGAFYAHFRAPADIQPPSDGGAGPVDRIGRRMSDELARRGIRYTQVRRDLALTGQTLDALIGRKTIAGACGLLGGLLAWAALRYEAGLSLPPGSPAVLAALAGAGLFLAPDADIRREAGKRRAEFREQLSIFLDLVSLKMAGHAAAGAALPEAAQRGGGWPMMLIRDTLFRARLSGENEWEALARLGERIAVPDLRDLGALVKLVADDGAQVRATLTARAASMRRARLADEAAGAEERNQSMRLAHMLIAVGFMIFVGYPAFVNIQF